MRIYKTTKEVLSIQNNADKFLIGLTSNTLDQPRNAVVTVHGKIIATFDQIRLSEEEVWLVIEQDYVTAVVDHLSRYAPLSHAKIESRNLQVYFDLLGDYTLVPGDLLIPQKKGQLILTTHSLLANVDKNVFTQFRVEHNIPLLGVDYKDEFLLNISEKEFVSFTKGCYLGQEPISKVHNRSKPTWRLVVKPEHECTDEQKSKMTSRITHPVTGQIEGFVFVPNA